MPERPFQTSLTQEQRAIQYQAHVAELSQLLQGLSTSSQHPDTISYNSTPSHENRLRIASLIPVPVTLGDTVTSVSVLDALNQLGLWDISSQGGVACFSNTRVAIVNNRATVHTIRTSLGTRWPTDISYDALGRLSLQGPAQVADLLDAMTNYLFPYGTTMDIADNMRKFEEDQRTLFLQEFFHIFCGYSDKVTVDSTKGEEVNFNFRILGRWNGNEWDTDKTRSVGSVREIYVTTKSDAPFPELFKHLENLEFKECNNGGLTHRYLVVSFDSQSQGDEIVKEYVTILNRYRHHFPIDKDPVKGIDCFYQDQREGITGISLRVTELKSPSENSLCIFGLGLIRDNEPFV